MKNHRSNNIFSENVNHGILFVGEIDLDIIGNGGLIEMGAYNGVCIPHELNEATNLWCERKRAGLNDTGFTCH